MQFNLPYIIDRYKLIRILGEGGMATVYQAVYEGKKQFQKEFAIKLIMPHLAEDLSVVNMLIDEANLQSQLEHDNIVKVFELGSVDKPNPVFFIVMEYVRGPILENLFKTIQNEEHDIPIGYKLYIVHEILNGLQYAHTKLDIFGNPLKIIHRDISLHNILISNEGRVKITDFGIAKAKLHCKRAATKQLSSWIGKFSYMSPEQALDCSDLDHRTDLFSTGVILLELLTGKKVFNGESDLRTFELVKTANYPKYLLNNLDNELVRIVQKALSKNPDDRYQTAQDFANDIWKFMQSQSLYVTDKDLGNLLKLIYPNGYSMYDKGLPLIVNQPSTILPPVESERTLPEKTQFDPQRVSPAVESKSRQKKGTSKLQRIIIPSLLGGLCIFYGFLHFMTGNSKKLLPIQAVDNTPISKQLFAVEMENLKPEAQKKEEEVLNQPIAKIANGYISVVATPWAYLRIPKIIEKKETPFSKALTPGSYQIYVWRPGQNGQAKLATARKIIIKPQQTTRCIALFDATTPVLTCN